MYANVISAIKSYLSQYKTKSSHILLFSVIAVIITILFTFRKEFADMIAIWAGNDDYSHGFLVIPVTVAILYARWPGLSFALSRSSGWGWATTVVTLAIRAYLHESGRPLLEQLMLLPMVVGLALALGGWRAIQWSFAGFIYLIFMYPLPPKINQFFSTPLQRLATNCTVELVRLSGLWITAEGNIIYVGDQSLEVARACNGLSMLMTMVAITTFLVLLVPMPVWKRLTLLATSIPVALACNVIRISITAWCYHIYGSEIGEKYVHTWAGFLMMPLALVMVGFEMLFLSWLVVEQEEIVFDKPISGLAIQTVFVKPRS